MPGHPSKISARINPWLKLNFDMLARLNHQTLEEYLEGVIRAHVQDHIPKILSALESPACDLTHNLSSGM